MTEPSWWELVCGVLAGAMALERVHEYREEARRCRLVAQHALTVMETNGVLIEFAPVGADRNAGFGVVICAPNMDEGNLGECARICLREFFEGMNLDQPPGMDDLRMRVTGTGGDGKE